MTTGSNPRAIPTRQLGQTGLHLSEVGFGTAALGNLYQPISDEQAREALEAGLLADLRYVDTAPYYGFGLSERRVGDVLRDLKGNVLSSKVGRLLVPSPVVTSNAERGGFHSSLPFEVRYDYSHSGVLRSYEDSLQRLGLARIDILLVHDIGTFTHGSRHEEMFEQLTTGGGLRALEELRSAGTISAFGIGVNEIDICIEVMRRAPIDIILLAGRYTLLEQAPLDTLFPACSHNGTKVVIGGPYNSGILASGTSGGGPLYYNYLPAPPDVISRVQEIEKYCNDYDVPLAAAALQFPLAHPQVVSVIPGHDTAARVSETVCAYRRQIPSDFWQDLRTSGLIRADAPTPAKSPSV